MNLFKKYIVIGVSVLALTSCAAFEAGVSSNKMEASTKISKTVWLDPIAPSEKIVFVDVRNSSDNARFNDLGMFVKNNLMAKGYLIEENPQLATYTFQVNVRQAVLRDNKGKGASSEAAIQGAAIGGLAGSASGGYGNNKSMATGILAGAAAGLIANAMYEDMTYYVNADLRIIENKTKKVHTNTASLTATKINMEMLEAETAIKQNLSQSLAGMF